MLTAPAARGWVTLPARSTAVAEPPARWWSSSSNVVGLKHVNDSEGHDAGDRLLKRVVATISEHLRPYDFIVRLGGDEFLCALSNMTLTEARRRFHDVAGTLATGGQPAALRTGFAQLTAQDTATELIARADTQLNTSRRDTDAPR